MIQRSVSREWIRIAALCVLAAGVLALGPMARAQDTPAGEAPASAEATPAGETGTSVESAGPEATSATAATPPAAFDPVAETTRYLATISAEDRARSDAYFEGGYWILLWGVLITLLINLFLLKSRWSARMRDWAERVTGKKPVHSFVYVAQYIAVTTVLFFPWTLYTGYIREHQYGLATQTFGPWFRDFAVNFGVNIVLLGLLLVAIYGVIRKARQTWWLWGAGVTVVFFAFVMLISPVFIAPLFNTYTPLEEGPVRAAVLSMARANGVPADEVYLVDASRQTTRISANVSGLLGTMRISLNDNLLNQASLPEIKAVMGHEMGHYLLGHIYVLLTWFGLVIVGGFAFVAWGFKRVCARWGRAWGVRDIGDVAGLPLIAALIAAYFFVMTPVTNTISRVSEREADIFGLNAAREPDGFAQIALKLSTYRKMHPTPLEEFVFYDHPSGYNRILMAMRWKAENLTQ